MAPNIKSKIIVFGYGASYEELIVNYWVKHQEMPHTTSPKPNPKL